MNMITKERLEQISRGTFTGDDGIKDIAQYLVEQAEKQEVMKSRPRAEEGGKYCYVDEYFRIYQTVDTRDAIDGNRYGSGNYFLTEQEAQTFADKIKELRKTM